MRKLLSLTILLPAGLLGLLATPLSAHAANPITNTFNWAGVTARNGYYSGVAAQIRLPVVAPTVMPNGVSAWVGIGGADTPDLIQAGVDITNGQTACVWVETLPGPQQCVGNFHLGPGNLFQIIIAEGAPDQWTVQAINGPETWQHTLTYHSSHTSAEWVVEPTMHFDGSTLTLPTADISFYKMYAILNGAITSAGWTTPTLNQLINNLGQPRANGWATPGEPAGTSYIIHTYGN